MVEAATLPEDPITVAEGALKELTLRFTEAALKLTTGLIGQGGPAATRGLHLTEGVAGIQAHMLRLLGMAKRPTRRGKIAMSSYGMLGQYGGLDDYESDPETYTGDAQGETFGNKALQQLIAMVKPLMQQNAAVNANKEVESLTKALVEATKGGLGDEVVHALRQKLEAALATALDHPLAALPEPIEAQSAKVITAEEDHTASAIMAPAFVCGIQEGM